MCLHCAGVQTKVARGSAVDQHVFIWQDTPWCPRPPPPIHCQVRAFPFRTYFGSPFARLVIGVRYGSLCQAIPQGHRPNPSRSISLLGGGVMMAAMATVYNQDGVTLDMLRRIDRNQEPPDEGLMCELLWSDPGPTPGRSPSKRGVGVAFGADVTASFLALNNLELVIRSHEVKDEGYVCKNH